MKVYMICLEKDLLLTTKVFDSGEKAEAYMNSIGYYQEDDAESLEDLFYKDTDDGEFLCGAVVEIEVE